MARFDEEKQRKKVEELRFKEEEELAEILSHKYGISYVDLSTKSIDMEAIRLVQEDVARKGLLAPFHLTGNKLYVAVHSPQKPETKFIINDLERQGYTIILNMVSMASLKRAWARYSELSYAHGEKAGVLEISNDDIAFFLDQMKNINDLRELLEKILEDPGKVGKISRVLEIVLAGSFATDASDIHIEPEESHARLRLRLDGVLQDILFFDPKIYKLAISRIKLVSGMKLNINDISQDGRFTVKLGGNEIEVRASALPGTHGESIVLRILNPKIINIPFEELGIDLRLKEEIIKQLAKPNGMILTTGPTGSGKTTSLYAFMKKIYSPGIKVITIENPIEYHISGIVQTQTDEHKGYTFFTGLRSALRQDPDIIMVGEIRDPETARTAVDASLTGHLVFSTLHTNNAAGTIPRLTSLGVNPKIIPSSVNITLAQRLIRILCKVCKKEDKQTEKEKNLVDSILSNLVKRQETNTGTLWRAVGCGECNGTGYKGQIGLYEGILIDEAIEKIIEMNPTDRDIKKASRQQGFIDMREDGILKALHGITSIDEVYRVVDITGER